MSTLNLSLSDVRSRKASVPGTSRFRAISPRSKVLMVVRFSVTRCQEGRESGTMGGALDVPR